MTEQSVKVVQGPAVRRRGRWAVLGALAAGLCLAAGLGGYSAYREYVVWRHAQEAQRALGRGDLEGARAHLAACLEARPENAGYHFLAGRTARRLGRYDEAEQHLRRCLQLGGRRDDVNLELRLLRAQQGVPGDDARQLLAEVDAGHPDAILILEALAHGYMLSSFQVPRALDCLNRWLERDPKAVQALIWRGVLYERLHQPERARDDFTAAVALDEDNFESRDRLAWLLVLSGRLSDAVPHLERMRAQQPHHPHVLLGLALFHREQGQPEEAARLLDILLTEQPNLPEALRDRGLLALSAGQPERAEVCLRRAVRLNPFDRETNKLLADCLDRLNARRGRGFAPSAPLLSLYRELCHLEVLGYQCVYRRLVADGERFERLYAEIFTTAPRNPEPYCEIGQILLREGHPVEAREWFQQALRLEPGHKPAREALERMEQAGEGS